MKALVLKEYRRFAVEERPVPVPASDEVLIRVRACGICGSDVHGMDGSTGRRIPPLIMGHEAAGEIVQAGSGIKNWRQEDRVTFDSTIYCGSCWHCLRGEVNLCENRRVLGVSCAEYRRDGAFAEYVAVPERILYRLPPGLNFEHAAMVEAVAVAVHAVRRSSLPPSATCVVVGAGMIGLLVVQVLRVEGCSRIMAVDLDENRLKLARKLGATDAIRADHPELSARVLAATDGRGADAAFEAVGISAAVQTAVASVRKGGSVTLVGNLSPQVELPLQSVVTRELKLIGSCASAGEYPA
ncbi:MAG: alcohol dehydrogenase catalytic domain-containing protein, partial [Acidobacteriota bacterium]|nr:alcohol dehydrogenase catalytic domain-containing protein [Acidobacteriota bacterium]